MPRHPPADQANILVIEISLQLSRTHQALVTLSQKYFQPAQPVWFLLGLCWSVLLSGEWSKWIAAQIKASAQSVCLWELNPKQLTFTAKARTCKCTMPDTFNMFRQSNNWTPIGSSKNLSHPYSLLHAKYFLMIGDQLSWGWDPQCNDALIENWLIIIKFSFFWRKKWHMCIAHWKVWWVYCG